MKKRLISFAMVLATSLAAFGGIGSAAVSGAEKEIDLSKKMIITVTRRGNVREVNKENMFASFLEEKFNVVLQITDINANDYLTRMNLMFATDEATDVALAHRPAFMLNEWTEAGYLRGFTKEEIQEKLPNYIASYSEDAWDVVWSNISHSDGKAYYLPGRRYSNMNMAWMYREDLFEKYNLSFPETTDEIFDTLMTLKDKTGKIPVVAANAGDPIWAFTGWFQPFGIPELAASDVSYVNPKTEEFVPYAFTTDDFRKHTAFIHKLYENNLIWKEFSTGTTEQKNKLISQGNGFVMWGYPQNVDIEYNELSRTENPDASWAWADVMLTENPENGHFFKREPYFNADGVGFYSYADEEKVERFLYMMNWFYSEEGQIFHTYGIEDVHYDILDGNYIIKEHMDSPAKAGEKLENYGFIPMSVDYVNKNEYYRPYLVELEKQFFNRENYYFFTKPVQKYTEEESRDLADYETNLNTTRNEYYSKFIVGQLDINDDREWAKYIDTMKRLGLERVEQIRTDAYSRSK